MSTRRVALVVPTALALLTACGGTETDSEEEARPALFTGGRIEATASLGTRPLPTGASSLLLPGAPDRGLVVRYTVTNTSSRSVVVNDRIPKGGVATGPSDTIDPIAAYVLAGAGGVAEITKRTFAQKERAFDYGVSIQGTVLAPGKSTEGLAFVTTPIKAGAPAWAVLPDSARRLPTTPTRWRMCVGVRPGPRSDDRTLDGGAHVMSSDGDDQRLLCSKAQPLPA